MIWALVVMSMAGPPVTVLRFERYDDCMAVVALAGVPEATCILEVDV